MLLNIFTHLLLQHLTFAPVQNLLLIKSDENKLSFLRMFLNDTLSTATENGNLGTPLVANNLLKKISRHLF